MKTTNIIYWVSTGIIFLFEGVMPAIFGNSEDAKQGISHLGYPEHFRILLTIFKIAGALALVLPMISPRIQEWAYAGFAFSLIFAIVGHCVVDGINPMSFFPLIILGILAVSYIYYHKIQSETK